MEEGSTKLHYRNIGIDLGSTSIKIFVQDVGLVANVKSVVAVNKETGQLIDIGARAYKMIGRVPDNVDVVSPLSNGLGSNLKLTQLLVGEILSRCVNVPMKKTRLFVCVHSGCTELEKFLLVNSIFSNQIGEIFLVLEPIASGFGAGFDLNNSKGIVVVNIGGSTTDMVYVESGHVVCSHYVKMGGKTIDKAIENLVCKKYGLYVGRLSAENLKLKAASLASNLCSNKFKVSGKDKFSQLPKSMFLNCRNVYDLIIGAVDRIVEEVSGFICTLPHGFEAVSKLVLTGGTSLIGGFAEYVAEKTPMETYVANDPISCAVFGLGELFNLVDLKSSSFIRSI